MSNDIVRRMQLLPKTARDHIYRLAEKIYARHPTTDPETAILRALEMWEARTRTEREINTATALNATDSNDL